MRGLFYVLLIRFDTDTPLYHSLRLPTYQRDNIQAATIAQSDAQIASSKKDYTQCITASSHALGVAPNNVSLRELRMKCYEGQGDVEGVVGDLT